MSLPPELRVLCYQLSSTPVVDLPRFTPTLLRHVLRCQIALSGPAGNAAKADASASSVLVHKLKTQLSTLINGKSPEGRFTAVVLIKAVVEVGGWEILHGAESWVRGLLSLLGVRNVSLFPQISKLTAK
jgi:pre-rRNA-processing protein RIX1